MVGWDGRLHYLLSDKVVQQKYKSDYRVQGQPVPFVYSSSNLQKSLSKSSINY